MLNYGNVISDGTYSVVFILKMVGFVVCPSQFLLFHTVILNICYYNAITF